MNTETKTKQEIARQRAIVGDSLSTQTVGLRDIWQQLINGEARVVDSFFTDDRCYIVIAPGNTSEAPLAGRRLEILQGILCGRDQKTVAIDLELAPSTVALNARLGLEALGVFERPSRVHPLLMLVAKAASRPDVQCNGVLSSYHDAGEKCRVVSVERPEHTLRRVLPPAELSVIERLVEGLCYQEIARHRGTSTRTIANQITAVFRRMRVSGRNDMLQRLFITQNLSLLPPRVQAVTDPSEAVEERGPARVIGGLSTHAARRDGSRASPLRQSPAF
jgi:DNA-binding NarL/FixJ family response regulator